MTTHAEIHNGGDWVLSGTKMWITNGSIADHRCRLGPDARRHPRLPWFRAGARGLSPRGTSTRSCRLRASVTSELHFDEVRLPADAVLPGVTGLKGPLSCLSEARFGIVWGVTGAGPVLPRGRRRLRPDPGAVRAEDRGLPADPGQAGLDAGRPAARPSCSRCTWGGSRRPGRSRRSRSAWAR